MICQTPLTQAKVKYILSPNNDMQFSDRVQFKTGQFHPYGPYSATTFTRTVQIETGNFQTVSDCVYWTTLARSSIALPHWRERRTFMQKGQRCPSQILERIPKRHQILFCRRGFKCSSTLRGSNSKSPHYLLSYLFWLNTLTGTVKAPTVNLLTLNTLRDTKTTF